ncbi:MAG: hypothetical protein WBO76_07050, partial [Saprospiraceae bacterium]
YLIVLVKCFFHFSYTFSYSGSANTHNRNHPIKSFAFNLKPLSTVNPYCIIFDGGQKNDSKSKTILLLFKKK